jgi:hypothetical protein
MKIANHNGAPSSSSATGSPTSPTCRTAASGPTPMSVYADWDAFVEFAGVSPLGTRHWSKPTSATGARASPGVRRSGSTTAATPRRRMAS